MIAIADGRPWPLGATFDGGGVNFALFSAHAERVVLCLFAPGGQEIGRIDLPALTDEVWHGYVEGLMPGQLYGYRVHGAYEPEAGHRFNPAKLLLDPYAKKIVGPLRNSLALMGYRVGSGKEDLSFDRRDSAFAMPKSQVVDPSFTWGDDRPPAIPWAETVIYEAHPKGLTMTHQEIPEARRGRFSGLASPPILDHLNRLGVSAIELLPVQAFLDEGHLQEQGLTNYWGYNSIGFFAPEPRYLGDGEIWEFQAMVRRFHSAGIEVILDVVYNHTAEGNHLGPTLSFRGIDNLSYYRLLAEAPRYYVNDTGCGNTLNLSHPRVLQLVMDSLRYWVEVMHVDGFRFDPASVLGREEGGFDGGSGFFDAIRQDPVLARVKLIAEPWDVGPGGYRLGAFPPGFGEWNDRYRDAVRRFWRGDQGMLPELAHGLLGSASLFEHCSRKPFASINLVTAHDGFVLEDLVSYDQKHNGANGEDNRDGHNANHSWNHGIEGPCGDPAVLEERAATKRNLLATLLLSQGTPMLLAGDEIGNSQQGNNNAYCQDNEISWLNWAGLDDELFTFVQEAIRLRRQHRLLGQPAFLHGDRREPDGHRVSWVKPDGSEKRGEDWQTGWARTMGLLLQGQGHALLILMNAHDSEVAFTLPVLDDPHAWRERLDSRSRMIDLVDALPLPAGAVCRMPARSLKVIERIHPQ
jgi:glycogen operon protein